MDNIIIREIEESDLEKGFLFCLDNLNNRESQRGLPPAGDATALEETDAEKILKKIIRDPNHIIHVAELDGQIVGSATLLIEQKFIHVGGLVGHIEDVVVRKEFERKNIGQDVVISLMDVALKRGCYKTILDCKDDVKEFYEKLGFKQKSNGMRYDYHYRDKERIKFL